MKRLAKAPWLTGTALALLFGAALVGGCKQSEGDVCQIDDDCKSGLVCNPGTMRCQQPGASVPDAMVSTIDAGPTIDSAPAPDADTTADAAAADAGAADAQIADAQTTD
jgi:hypothetical protein